MAGDVSGFTKAIKCVFRIPSYQSSLFVTSINLLRTIFKRQTSIHPVQTFQKSYGEAIVIHESKVNYRDRFVSFLSADGQIRQFNLGTSFYYNMFLD